MTVRFRDAENRNYQAMVIAVHPDRSVDLVYSPMEGEAVTLRNVPHRSSVTIPDAPHVEEGVGKNRRRKQIGPIQGTPHYL